MEEEKQEKILLGILTIIIVLVICGGFFAYLDIKTKKTISKLNNELLNIQAQKNLLEDKKGLLENQLQDLEEGIKPGTKAVNCEIELTSADKDMIEDWKEIFNSKHNFSFKYPKTWTIVTNKDDFIEIRGNEAEISLKVVAGSSRIEIEDNYQKKDESKIKVFCQDAQKIIYSGDDNFNLITVLFKKDEVSYTVVLKYKDIGASISGDILEAFDLILKTINFE